MTAPRTREGQTHRIVGRLREEIADLGASNVHVAWSREPRPGGGVMRLDDKLAALDNHAARRIDVREWEHLRILARAEGDARLVEECDYRIAKLTDRPDGGFAAKLAEAKRLGLEACHIARADRDDATEVDVARIAAALEAL